MTGSRAVKLVADAVLDPWCTVDVTARSRVLFGFAHRHPVTGGLAWTRSTPVVELDEVAGRALTRSGRQYELGRRIEPHRIPELGMEAWLAYGLLLGRHAFGRDEVPPISADPDREGRWITACKISRHLGVDAPPQVPSDVDRFLSRHFSAYLRLLQKLGVRS